MHTYHDSIELEDIDIQDARVSFYIILLPNYKYKLCATTKELDSIAFVNGDPETRIKTYWPISRKEINQANFHLLFPDSKLRNEPFSLNDLREAFNFSTTWSLQTTSQKRFGPNAASTHAMGLFGNREHENIEPILSDFPSEVLADMGAAQEIIYPIIGNLSIKIGTSSNIDPIGFLEYECELINENANTHIQIYLYACQILGIRQNVGNLEHLKNIFYMSAASENARQEILSSITEEESRVAARPNL